MTTTIKPPAPPSEGSPSGSSGGSGSSQRRIAGAAGIMMAGILGSRVLGLIRERVIAHQFGQGFNTDVYNGAFTIPDLLFFLIAGGALSSAFIPVFTEYISTNREREAWRIFSVVATVMTLVVSVFIILGEIFTTKLVMLTNPGYSLIPGKVEATVHLTQILLPSQLCFFLGGLMMGTLTSRNNFTGQALGPVIYNLGIIFGGLLLTRSMGVAGLCWGAVGGAVIGNLLLQWFLVVRTGGHYRSHYLKTHWKHPGVIQVWKLMLPVILGLALPQVSTIIGKMFASTLGDGPQSALMNANKLMQVPLGVFAQATAIAIFPTMAAQVGRMKAAKERNDPTAARNELTNLRNSVNFGIRSILFLTVPSSALMFVLALPFVQLLLQSGKFSGENAQIAAAALRYFAIGIFAWSGHSIITRGFYALQDSKTPVIVGTVVTAIFIPLNLVALKVTGTTNTTAATAGLAAVTSIAATLHMTSMLALLRNRLRGINAVALFTAIGKITLASAIAAIVCRILRDLMEGRYEAKKQAALLAGRAAPSITSHAAILLLVCLTVSVLIYGGLAFAFKMEEAGMLTRLLRRRARARA